MPRTSANEGMYSFTLNRLKECQPNPTSAHGAVNDVRIVCWRSFEVSLDMLPVLFLCFPFNLGEKMLCPSLAAANIEFSNHHLERWQQTVVAGAASQVNRQI